MGNNLPTFEIKLFVTGPRKVGKTALVQSLTFGNSGFSSYYPENTKFESFEYKNSRFIINDIGNAPEMWNKLYVNFKYLVFCINYHRTDKIDEFKREFWNFLQNNEKCVTSNGYVLLFIITKSDLILVSSDIKDEIIDIFELDKIKNILWNVHITSSFLYQGIDELKELILQIEQFWHGFASLPELTCFQTKKEILGMKKVKFQDLHFNFV